MHTHHDEALLARVAGDVSAGGWGLLLATAAATPTGGEGAGGTLWGFGALRGLGAFVLILRALNLGVLTTVCTNGWQSTKAQVICWLVECTAWSWVGSQASLPRLLMAVAASGSCHRVSLPPPAAF